MRLYAASGATFAYVSYILSTSFGDAKAANAANQSESKVPRILQRASINEFLQREEARKA